MKQHYVYIIQHGKRGPVKVGITKNMDRRMADLQTANPAKLYELARIPCDNEKQARFLESKFHHVFRTFRLNGEWFERKALNMIPKEYLPGTEKMIVNSELDRRHLQSITHLI